MLKVIYKFCEQAMQHSEAVNQSIINMHDHLKSSNCEQQEKKSSTTQSTINQHFHKVSILFVFNIYHCLTTVFLEQVI